MEKLTCVLFDMDGVMLDTEIQYDLFWGEVGKKYYPNIPNFSKSIKGTTLPNILKKYFSDIPKSEQDILVQKLDAFEENMDYQEIAGSIKFVNLLKDYGVKVGLVTSSTDTKMKAVNRLLHFNNLFDTIVTASDVKHGKPNPDCFLLGAKKLNEDPLSCIVFEDSIAGIKAAHSAGMTVIGVSTTLTKEQLEEQKICKAIIPNFEGFTIEKLIKLIK